MHDGEGGSQQDSMSVPWKEGVKISVPVVQLDDFVKEGERVWLLKSDTQGHEVQVLKGAHKLLSEHRIELIHIEYSPGLLEVSAVRRGAGGARAETANACIPV